MNRKTIPAVLALAVVLLALPGAYAINWRYDLAGALKDAKQDNKPVMADFYTDWCGWCKKLDSDTYSNAKVSAISQKFICVKINAEKDTAAASRYGISAYPTILFLDGSGKVIAKIPGYLPADRFYTEMNKVLLTMPQPDKNASAEKGGGFIVLEERQKDKDGKPLPPKTVGQEFVYNGYVETRGDELIAQVNYKGETYFVKKGERVAEYSVVSADKEKVVLSGNKGEVVLEFKKPVRSGGESLGAIKDMFADIVPPPAAEDAAQDREGAAPLPSEILSGRARMTLMLLPTMIFGVLMAVFYVYWSLCLQFIASKTNTANAWMAWVPVLSFFLMLNVSKTKYRIFLLPVLFFVVMAALPLFAPMGQLLWFVVGMFAILNSIYFVILLVHVWYRIAVARGKSTGLSVVLAIMMFLSPLNLFAIGYLAFSK